MPNYFIHDNHWRIAQRSVLRTCCSTMAHDKPTKKVRGRLSIVEMIDVVENNELTLFSIKRIGEKSRGALPSNCWNGSQTDIEGIVYV